MTGTATDLLSTAARLEDPGEALTAVCDLRRHLDRLQAVHVENALRAGWSWSQIAGALGVTRQAAHRRYARVVREQLEEARDTRVASGEFVLTGASRLAVHLGRQEAGAMRCPQLGTEHVLLGLLRAEVSRAARVLRAAGVDLQAARDAVRELGEDRCGGDDSDAFELEPTPNCRAAFERALHEAVEAGSDRLRPEHLLMALLADSGSGAVRALAHLGVEADAIDRTLRAEPRFTSSGS
jgi:hypothetical protein